MKSACFYVIITANCECFQYLNFETTCPKKKFVKKLEYLVRAKFLFHNFCLAKLSYRKPMLRQIEWGVQNRPILKK